MSFENFAYWLQGYFELTYTAGLTNDQVSIIKEHLNLCFNKVTPSALGTYCDKHVSEEDFHNLFGITEPKGISSAPLC